MHRAWILSLVLAACRIGGDKDPVTAADTDGVVDTPDTDISQPPTGDCPADLLRQHAAAPQNSAYPAPMVDGFCERDTFTVRSNGIPHFEFVPLTPNDLSAQDYTWSIPRNPAIAAAPTDLPLLGLAGFTLTGLPVYGPNEGPFPDPFGDPIFNGIVDTCLGHTAQQGDYHGHGIQVDCVHPDATGSGPDPIVGYALDGFPIYGPRGCTDAACTEIVTFRSGWTQTGDPTTEAWDNHAYTPSTDPEVLDRCNGRVGPDGTYRYHATATFPYILGCYTGTARGAGGSPDGPGVPPDCADVPPGSPCCGDGICGGPETPENCPADCD